MTTCKKFIEKVEGKKIVDVQLLEGEEEMDCGTCQFQFTTEDGYKFVG